MGRVFKFHNDVDTDQIIASQYLLLPNIEEMKVYTLNQLIKICQEGKRRRYCCSRRELWMWVIQRTGAKCIESVRCQSSGC